MLNTIRLIEIAFDTTIICYIDRPNGGITCITNDNRIINIDRN